MWICNLVNLLFRTWSLPNHLNIESLKRGDLVSSFFPNRTLWVVIKTCTRRLALDNNWTMECIRRFSQLQKYVREVKIGVHKSLDGLINFLHELGNFWSSENITPMNFWPISYMNFLKNKPPSLTSLPFYFLFLFLFLIPPMGWKNTKNSRVLLWFWKYIYGRTPYIRNSFTFEPHLNFMNKFILEVYFRRFCENTFLKPTKDKKLDRS